MENINNIGCKWRIVSAGDFVELDVHQSNFHAGTCASDSPKYAKIMYRANGERYVRHAGKTWNID